MKATSVPSVTAPVSIRLPPPKMIRATATAEISSTPGKKTA